MTPSATEAHDLITDHHRATEAQKATATMVYRFLNVRVSYQIVTPSSAAEGDAAERGFVIMGQNWPLDQVDDDPTESCTAHEALRILRDHGCYPECTNRGDSATFYGHTDTDYRTGEETSYAVHVEGPARLIAALIASADR